MTFDDVVARLRALGFVLLAHEMGDGRRRARVGKPVGMAGNHGSDGDTSFEVGSDDGRVTCHDVHRPCPTLWERDGAFELDVHEGVPTVRGDHVVVVATAAALYEAVLHYFFDTDSKMQLYEDFVPGPGRPAGA